VDKQILLVDDDIDDHEIFCMALENLENCYKCIFAKDGIEALEILKNEEIFIPDIIFLDLNMPRMNGIECLYEIKKNHRTSHIPVIMYSTSSDPKIVEGVKDLGASEYLVKPSRIETLSGLLGQIFKNHFFSK
jgi:CheY-like chemotaxis protein